MKTGTPVRIDRRSVHFEDMECQPGETDYHGFSYMTAPKHLKQLPCWTTYTNKEVHDTLRDAIAESPLYNGQIKSTGPRYCPSIETKLVTFPDKDQHPLFLEPEGENTNEMYLNGFSSSMPMDVQLAALKKIKAFRDIKVYRPGYAIEYDYFDPTQLKPSLESKKIKGLFFAGQVNGTTGYEEAGGQGTMAGINAALLCGGSEPFIMKRDEGYIGVLIDDLTTKGETERIINFCNSTNVKPRDINAALESFGTTPMQFGATIASLVARPQLSIKQLASALPSLKAALDTDDARQEEIVEAAEVLIKYDGYIKRERQIADKMHRLEDIRIKGHFNYEQLHEISTEGRQKLIRINPETLGQASRIPGVSPSDINVLLVLMHR